MNELFSPARLALQAIFYDSFWFNSISDNQAKSGVFVLTKKLRIFTTLISVKHDALMPYTLSRWI